MRGTDLKLTGRSGCQIEVIQQPHGYFVRKWSKDEGYSSRLILQAQKQEKFPFSDDLLTPKVFQIEKGSGLSFFDMEYIPGEKYSEFFTRCSKSAIDNFLDVISQYFTGNFKKSECKIADKSTFLEKAESLKQILVSEPKPVQEKLNSLMQLIPSGPVSHGYCHGDLTFSNMIFSSGKIYLVDFLDSFFNSPLIDLVKLRQDTHYYWTLFAVDEIETYKKNKMLQILQYIDTHLQQTFLHDKEQMEWYNYLQCFNLLRILPYISLEKERNLVINALSTIKL